MDPGEMNNLAVDSDYNSVLKKHRAYLEEWITKTSDRFDMPN